ncbi:MAG: alpha/beta fold hydrolase, partial [Anaerolineae bacterium]
AAPVVMLHGATTTFRSTFRRQLPAFGAVHRVIGVDLRGHGQSNNPADALDLRQLADDIAALLDHLEIDKASLLGFSGGASVSLFFAVRHLARLDALVMVSNNMELDRARAELDFWDVERVRTEEPKWFAAMEQLHNSPVEKLLDWWAQEDTVRPDWRPEQIAHVDVPTLVMGGDRDPIIPLDQTLKLYEALPNAELAILPGVGHGIPSRRPEVFNRLVLDFLHVHSVLSAFER